MNHWKETTEILTQLGVLSGLEHRAVLATVVRIAGSAYRRPGAKLLVEESGATLGSVSGGCLEADVREISHAVLETRTSSLRRYDSRGAEDLLWGLDLGCRGEIDIYAQPATEGPFAIAAAPLRELLAADAVFAIATAIEGPAAGAVRIVTVDREYGTLGSSKLDSTTTAAVRGLFSTGESAVHAFGEHSVFFEVLRPPPRLVVCGAGDDAQPLVAYATEAGFRVIVIDHRPALLQPARFPQAAALLEARPDHAELASAALESARSTMAIVKTHSLTHDREWTRHLLAAGLPYVGVLGPRQRTEAILLEIGAQDDERIYGPVGLDLGADGPRQIAISIVAELLAFSARREPRHLRQRSEAIHVG